MANRLFWIAPIVVMGIGFFPMPYGYYNILRVVVFVSSVFMIARAMKVQHKQSLPWLFSGVALLYNPILPIHLNDKSIWMIVNALTAVLFILFRYLTLDEKDNN